MAGNMTQQMSIQASGRQRVGDAVSSVWDFNLGDVRKSSIVFANRQVNSHSVSVRGPDRDRSGSRSISGLNRWSQWSSEDGRSWSMGAARLAPSSLSASLSAESHLGQRLGGPLDMWGFTAWPQFGSCIFSPCLDYRGLPWEPLSPRSDRVWRHAARNQQQGEERRSVFSA